MTTADKTPPATETTTRQRKSRRVASEPMLSKLSRTSRTTTTSQAAREQQVDLSPLAASARSRRTSRTFDFHRATKAALASSDAGQFSSPRSYATERQVAPGSPSPAATAGAHYHLLKKTNNNKKKKTRTPRKAPNNVAAQAHPPSLVKSMLGLAARAVKAFSTARGRRRSMLLSATAEERDKLLLSKRRSGLEPEWTDDDAHDSGQETEDKPRQVPRTKVSPKATVVVKKRTRVSNGSARSRLAREEEEEVDTVHSPLEPAPPRTPRIAASTIKSRRQKVGTATSSSAKRHPSSSGGASTFRASSSRKRVRVYGGRPSLSGSISVSGRTAYPSSVLSSSAAILNRARPVSRSEALVGEYTARAISRSSVNGGGVANELLRMSTPSTTSYDYYRPRRGEVGCGETEEEEEGEEWVEEARIDEFGAALPTYGHDTQIRETKTLKLSYIARLDQQQGARGRFSRSLAPSPISIRTTVRNPVHSRATNSDEKQQLPSTRNSSVLSLRDLSHCAVADESQLLDDEENEDNSASSPLSAFVRQLAKAAAQSSSQDGDVEDSSAGGDGGGGGGLDSPTPTSTSGSEAWGPYSSSPASASRSSAFRLPEWLPFASAAAEWTRDQSSEDENGDEEAARAADEDALPSPFEDASEDASEAGEGAGAEPEAAASMRRSPPPRRRGPMASSVVFPRQVDSADLASARLIGAKRLSRELATTASLAAVLKRSNSPGSGGGGGGGGNGSAPVSPTSFAEEDGTLLGSSSPIIGTDFGPANATGSGGRIGFDQSQETLRPTGSASSSRLPSLSPVSPFKFRFSSESSPAAAAAAESAIDPSLAQTTTTTTTTPPPPTGPSQDLRHSYRELTRRSADFALASSPAASHVSAAAMRETALEVFGRLSGATAATPPFSGADSNSNSKQQDTSLELRRTIRPGDGASLDRTNAAGEVQKKKKNGGAWEIYRDEVVDESNTQEDVGSSASRSGAEMSEAEAGVLAERTEASMLRKVAAIRSRGSGARTRARFGTQPAAVTARNGNSAEEEAEGEKENARGYFSA